MGLLTSPTPGLHLQYKRFDDIVDEIRAKVDHLQPFMLGKSQLPSTGYCLLYKLFVMKVTIQQLKSLIARKQNPYVRGIGFLFLRYTAPSKSLFEWCKPHLDDEQLFAPAGGIDKKMVKMCVFLEGILTDMRYYGTNLPRIPMLIEKDIKIHFLMIEKKRERARQNSHIAKYLVEGTRVKAEWSQDKQWYDAIIEQVLGNDWYLVTFTEYGNQEEVDIGCIKLVDENGNIEEIGSDDRKRDKSSRRSRSRSRDRRGRDRRRSGSRSRSRRRSRSSSRKRHRRSRSRTPSSDKDRRSDRSDRGSRSGKAETVEDIEAELRRREMEKATVSSGKSYATRPTSYKTSLSLLATGKTERAVPRARSRSPPRPSSRRGDPPPRRRSPSPPRKKEPSHAEKMRSMQLKMQYGDATASKSYGSQAKAGGKVESTDVIRLGF